MLQLVIRISACLSEDLRIIHGSASMPSEFGRRVGAVITMFAVVLCVFLLWIGVFAFFERYPNFDFKNVNASIATIQGSLSFPSEHLPQDLEVCAESVSDKRLFCTNAHLVDKKFATGVGYKLEIPAGSYTVYAHTPALPNYKAYYSKAVICGLTVACTTHTPLVVNVFGGQHLENINPGDWYAGAK